MLTHVRMADMRAAQGRLMKGVALAACLLVMGLLASVGVQGAHAQAHALDNNAYVRVVHAAPAAPSVDVYVDKGSTPLLPSFAFGTLTGYVPLAAGSHTIDITAAGQPISKAVISGSVSVTAGMYYTVAAIGDTNTTPALVAFQDDNSVASGMAKVRVYHLSSDAGPVSVATGGNTVIPSLSFKNASGYLTVPSGSYTFNVTLLNSNKSLSLPATLDANKVTSVFALGLANGSGATAFKFVPAAVAGIPTGWPPTGFAPQRATLANSSLLYWSLAGAVALILAGAGALGIVRRRAR